jgi:hypothetical protein
MKSHTSQRGYTLLFAVLTATLVLGVTVFIVSVSKKQFALSNIARESMFAIYAADGGIECIAADAYRTSTSTSSFICDGKTINKVFRVATVDEYPATLDPRGDVYISKFTVGFKNETPGSDDDVYGCAVMSVLGFIRDEDGVPGQAIITSRGYNLCSYTPPPSGSPAGTPGTYAPDISSTRTVERAMQLIYR